MKSAGVHKLNTNELAYVLATAHYESRWKNFDEPYPPGTDKKEYFNQLYNGVNGNIVDTDDGYLFHGRGFIHLTGRANYERLQHLLGVNFTAGLGYADRAYGGSGCPLAPTNCITEIAIVGMKQGLGSYISLTQYNRGCDFDFVGARDTINGNPETFEDGSDLRGKIAELAKAYAIKLSERCKIGGLPDGVVCH